MAKVKPTLNQADIDIITTIVDDRLDKKLGENFQETFSFLPSKDEFYAKMDQVMGELAAIREIHEITTYKVADHEDRLETIETKLAITP